MNIAERTASVGRYVAFFESLSPDTLPELSQHVTDDVHFRDPFNDFTGRPRMERAFRHMFKLLDEVRFEVLDVAHSDTAAYLRWTMVYRRKQGPERRIEGMSEIALSEDGRVSAHIDHWDAAGQLYERLPVIGGILRSLRRRLQVD
ncbi:nuclear transport factor 2 family protein [Fodinicurvata halophila]|uniref:Nuclear transport factor 2 family protein n=1 Tax=Fodinicurvata halophila TaxID=1419723 RepID=A0ABV8UN48_9PROT